MNGVLNKHWDQYLLRRMGYVKRKDSSKTKITIENLASLKYLLDIRGIVDIREIPQDLILNWVVLGDNDFFTAMILALSLSWLLQLTR